MLAPARTPRAIVERLNQEIRAILQSPDMHNRLTGAGADPVGNSPAEFAAFLKEDAARWEKVIKQLGAKLD